VYDGWSLTKHFLAHFQKNKKTKPEENKTVPDIDVVAELKKSDLSQLDNHLSQNSYIVHYQPTQADSEMHKHLQTKPYHDWPNITRWMNHISSFGDDSKNFPSQVPAFEIALILIFVF
jgi:glutathione S-transferase